MISLLVKQSVQRKMEFGASKLLGAYEFYYSAGFIYGKLGIEAPSRLSDAGDIKSVIEARKSEYTAGDKKLKYLIDSVLDYSVDGIDAQKDQEEKKSLFEDGLTDGHNYG